MLSRPAFVLALDTSWSGTGYALIGADRTPIAVGCVAVGKMARLSVLLSTLEAALGDRDAALVLEKPNPVYSGKSRGTAGNQYVTGFGMGRLYGAIEYWWASRSASPPVELLPDQWRASYGIKGQRADVKAAALSVVNMLRLSHHLPEGGSAAAEDRQIDAAEAMLMGLSALTLWPTLRLK